MIRSYTRWRDCYSDTIGVYLTAVPCELHEIVEQLFMSFAGQSYVVEGLNAQGWKVFLTFWHGEQKW